MHYKGGSKWTQRPTQPTFSPQFHHREGRHDSFSVHFKLLATKLLVNTVPLARPAVEYEQNVICPLLFGRSHVQVMSPSKPGFRLSPRSEYAVHLYHGLVRCCLVGNYRKSIALHPSTCKCGALRPKPNEHLRAWGLGLLLDDAF